MNVFIAQLKREFWENRGAFLIAPVTISLIMIALNILAIFTLVFFSVRLNGEEFMLSTFVGQIENVDAETLRTGYNGFMHAIAMFFLMIMAFIVFFYALGALYDDHKDRSILFWRSLPVSDTMTVLSKLTMALLVAPVIFIIVIALTHVAFLLIGLIMLASGGADVWTSLLEPAQPFSIWLSLLAMLLVHILWAAPLYAWCLLASSFARGKPFLWAVIPPVLAGMMQSWVNFLQTFDYQSNWILQTIGERLMYVVIPQGLSMKPSGTDLEVDFEPDDFANLGDFYSGLAQRLIDPDLIWGIPFAVLFIAAAIWIRRYRDEA